MWWLCGGDVALTGFLEDGFGCGGPLERLGIGVACVQVVLDRCEEIGYRVEHSVTDCFVGDLTEPSHIARPG